LPAIGMNAIKQISQCCGRSVLTYIQNSLYSFCIWRSIASLAY